MNERLIAAVVLTSVTLLAAPVWAHDGEHEPTDPSTPRDAGSHVTGKMERSREAGTDAPSRAEFEVRDGYRYVTANGVPDHETGRFPNRGNPNVVSEQEYSFRIPLDPAPPKGPINEASQITSDRGVLFGIALNGVVFEPATGLNWTLEGVRRGGQAGDWVYEAVGGSVDFGVDYANAHVQRTGAYHYHGIPTPMIKEDQPTLLGYAADGYPIYGPLGFKDPNDATSEVVTLKSSWQLKTQERPSPPDGPGEKPDGRFTADFEYVVGSGDLDYLNGRFAVTPEYPEGVYHYVVTEAFPHIPRGFAGTPDRSFRRLPGQGPNHVDRRGDRLPIGDR